MRSTELGIVGKRALVTLLALCMSFMMVPATAFADIGGKTYEVEVNASEGDASHTTGEDVAATYNPAVGVLADNGHSAEVVVGDVTQSSGVYHAVLIEADNGGKADVAMGDITGRLKWGNNGIDVVAKGGDVELTAGDVQACKVGLNLDSDPTGTHSDYTGEKRVTVNSVTQVEDSRYSNAGINAFSYTEGDTNIVHVICDVIAAGSRGIDMLAKGGSTSSVTVDGMVDANYLGVKVEAGSLGNVHGTTASTGTANMRVGGVVSKNWDKAVEIDSNTKGSIVNFRSDGDIQALGPDSTGVFARADGGKNVIVIDGDATGTKAGMFLYCSETGSNDVLVTGTISGKNGVDISYNSVENDSLTVWKIEKGSDGQYISGEEVGTPSDDREIFAKKRVNYIVFVENLLQGVTLSAFKADSSALDKSHDYDVAHEGDKIIVKVDVAPGAEFNGVYNGKGEQVPLGKDADGNYYIIVPRGGGIYLSALNEGEEIIVIPPSDMSAPVMPAAKEAVEDAWPLLTERVLPLLTKRVWPLLVYQGVEINSIKLEMDGQTPMLRTKLSNTNGNDVKFDCDKFKVVKVDDESEVVFKAEPKELKANDTNVKCELKAEENAMQAGDRAYVFYDDQLLGTFTVA